MVPARCTRTTTSTQQHLPLFSDLPIAGENAKSGLGGGPGDKDAWHAQAPGLGVRPKRLLHGHCPSSPVCRTEFGRYALPAVHFSTELLGRSAPKDS